MTNLFFTSLSLVFIFLSISCSFSKDHTSDDIVSYQEKFHKMSDVQEKILAAIKSGDVERLRISIKSAKTSDFNFQEFTSTPLSVALENQNITMLKELKDLGFDQFDLGSYSFSLSEKFIDVSLKKTLEKLNHSEAEKIDVSLNDAEQFIYTEQQLAIASALTSKNISIFKSHNKLCPFLEGQITILHALSSTETFKNAEHLIKLLQCNNTMKMEQLSRIYQMELINQFQKKFSNTSLLKYLVHHRNFEGPMWNIDNSNILVSPALLYRASFYRQKNADNIDNESSNEFLKRLEMPPPRYELVHVTESKRYSFFHFPEMALNDSDVFFEKLYSYMHGQKIYYTSTDPHANPVEKPWIINFQESDDGFYE